MKTLLILTVVLATALCAPTKRQIQQRQSLAEAQQMRRVLADLLRKTSTVNAQQVPAEMQSFWNHLKKGLGFALKLAHKHVLPMLEGGGERREGEEPARRQQEYEDYARFEQMGEDYATMEQDDDDYALEQVLSALQQYGGKADAQFDFGSLMGSLGKMFG